MPDHSTWFNYLLPNFEELLADFRQALGVTFLNHTPIEIQYVLGFLFIAVLLLILVFSVRGRINDVEKSLIPEGKLTLQTFFEAMAEGAINTMTSMMERKAALYFLPLIGTCAFVILFSNLIGLVPGFLPPTSVINTTLAMAGIIFLTTHIYGVKEHGFIKYFGHWCGPIHSWRPDVVILMILMFFIELIGHLARPASLSLRLAGNMHAGHLVMATFIGLFPLFLPVPIIVLKVLVCIVQTAVFCILSIVYIGMAIAHEEH